MSGTPRCRTSAPSSTKRTRSKAFSAAAMVAERRGEAAVATTQASCAAMPPAGGEASDAAGQSPEDLG